MKVEEYSNTVPVIRSVETAEDAENMFDHISYSKGSFLFIKKLSVLNKHSNG